MAELKPNILEILLTLLVTNKIIVGKHIKWKQEWVSKILHSEFILKVYHCFIVDWQINKLINIKDSRNYENI